ncbi:hypothetical protein [Staphylococcus epidermidis]
MIGRFIKIFSGLGTSEEEDKRGVDGIVEGEKGYLYGEVNKFNGDMKF